MAKYESELRGGFYPYYFFILKFTLFLCVCVSVMHVHRYVPMCTWKPEENVTFMLTFCYRQGLLVEPGAGLVAG